MKKNHKLLTTIFFSLLIFSSFFINKCSGEKSVRYEYEKIKREYKSLDENKKIGSGEFFIVELEISGGTGYEWNITNISNNIEFIKKEFFDINQKRNNEMVIGGRLKVIFLFKAKESGNGYIEFKLYRSWEKDKIMEEKKYVLEIM